MTWLEKLRQRNRSAEVLSPTDSATRNPYPGAWVVMGPTGEWAFSRDNAEEAALWYLASIVKDPEAREFLRTSPRLPAMKKAV